MAYQYAGEYAEILFAATGTLLPTTVATIYTDAGGTVLASLFTSRLKVASAANPIASDSVGNVSFFADPGVYYLKVGTDTPRRVIVAVDPVEATLVGTTIVTEYLTGQGAFSARGAAGTLGKHYRASDVGRQYLDTGTAWAPSTEGLAVFNIADYGSIVAASSITADMNANVAAFIACAAAATLSTGPAVITAPPIELRFNAQLALPTTSGGSPVGLYLYGCKWTWPTDLGAGLFAILPDQRTKTTDSFIWGGTLQGPGPNSPTLGVAPCLMSGVAMAPSMWIRDVDISRFYAGVDVVMSHTVTERCHIAKCYYGVYAAATDGGGGHKILDCVLDSNTFAAIASHPTQQFDNWKILRCRAGSAPYVFYQESNGGSACTWFNGSWIEKLDCEYVGNAFCYAADGVMIKPVFRDITLSFTPGNKLPAAVAEVIWDVKKITGMVVSEFSGELPSAAPLGMVRTVTTVDLLDLQVTDKLLAQITSRDEKVSVEISATAGTFTLIFGGNTTTALNYLATAAQVQTAFQALASVGAGNATVTYSPHSNPANPGGIYKITFAGTLAATNVGAITVGTGSLTGTAVISVLQEGYASGTLQPVLATGITNSKYHTDTNSGEIRTLTGSIALGEILESTGPSTCQKVTAAGMAKGLVIGVAAHVATTGQSLLLVTKGPTTLKVSASTASARPVQADPNTLGSARESADLADGVMGISESASATFVTANIACPARPRRGGQILQSSTDVGNVGAGEDDLMSFSVPATTMGRNDDSIEFDFGFFFAANANSKQVKVKWGATTIYDSTAQVQSGGALRVTGRIMRTSGTAQRVIVAAVGDAGTPLFTDVAVYTTATETLSGAVILKATGTAVADNDIIQKIGIVDYRAAT